MNFIVNKRDCLRWGGAFAAGGLGLGLGSAYAADPPRFKLQSPTVLPPTPQTWSFQVFANGDLLGIQRKGTKGKTEVHVVTSSSNYQKFGQQLETAMVDSPDSWEFVAMPNRDIMAVQRAGNSGKTEVHILDASKNYGAFKMQVPTALPVTDRRWSFGVNGDGDLVCINRLSATGKTEVYVLDASRKYGSFKQQTDTVLHATDTTWDFGVLPNGDVVGINRRGNSGKTELHVLDAGKGYAAFSMQAPTALQVTDDAWKFAVRANGDVFGVLTRDAASGKTEVHVVPGR